MNIQPQRGRAESPGARWARAVAFSAALIFSQVLTAEAADEGKTIVVAPGKSIQAAIDRAPAGAVIRLGEGEWKERITISKPLTLEGAGWEKTILKPDQLPRGVTVESKAQFRDRYVRGLSDAEWAALEREWAEKFARPTLLVRGTPKVIIRKLRVGGVAPPSEQPAGGEALVVFRKAQAVMSECAVVGPFEDGIQISGDSDVEVIRSFVAALRGEGINVEGRNGGADRPSRLHLVESEVRTVADGVHIGSDCDTTVIEGCRISGARQKGIHYEYASPRITGNVILKNGRSGVHAHGKTRAIVRANLFWKNEETGMSCWFRNEDTIEGNTFVENVREALFVMGSSKPAVTRNIFSDSPVGISCGMVGPQIGEPVLTANLFWQTASVLNAMGKKNAAPEGNLNVDPQFRDAGNSDFTLAPSSPARAANIGLIESLPVASPWPVLPEENPGTAATRSTSSEISFHWPLLRVKGPKPPPEAGLTAGFIEINQDFRFRTPLVQFEGFLEPGKRAQRTSTNALPLPADFVDLKQNESRKTTD